MNFSESRTADGIAAYELAQAVSEEEFFRFMHLIAGIYGAPISYVLDKSVDFASIERGHMMLYSRWAQEEGMAILCYGLSETESTSLGNLLERL